MMHPLGERVTIHPFGKRRYHHALAANCVALPAPYSLVQHRTDKAWYKFADISSQHSVKLYTLYNNKGSAPSGINYIFYLANKLIYFFCPQGAGAADGGAGAAEGGAGAAEGGGAAGEGAAAAVVTTNSDVPRATVGAGATEEEGGAAAAVATNPEQDGQYYVRIRCRKFSVYVAYNVTYTL